MVALHASGTSLFEKGDPSFALHLDEPYRIAYLESLFPRRIRIGKVKAIGVSNWSIPYLEKLSKSWKIVPAVNQVELHPYNPQHDLKEYCDDKGILLEAYCPLGSTGAPLLKDEVIIKIADKYNVSPATICISYQVNRGIVVLPKSVTAERESGSRRWDRSKTAGRMGLRLVERLTLLFFSPRRYR